MKKFLATLAISLVLFSKLTFSAHAPKIVLIEDGHELKNPTTPLQQYHQKELNQLLIQDHNLPGLFGVNNQFTKFQKKFKNFSKFLYTKNLKILTLQQKNSIIGALFFSPDPSTKKLFISLFAIDQNKQSNGLGSRMLNELERSYQGYTVSLKSYVQNKNANHFYKKQGFKKNLIPGNLFNWEKIFNTEKNKRENLNTKPETAKSIQITTIWGSTDLLYPKLLEDRILRKKLNKLMLKKENAPGLFNQTKEELKSEQKSLPIFLNQFYGENQNILLLHQDKILTGALFFTLLHNSNQKIIVYVTLLVIDASAQRKGYGKKLLNYLTQLYPDKTIRLSVFLKNRPARKFYERIGFSQKEKDPFCLTLEKQPTKK